MFQEQNESSCDEKWISYFFFEKLMLWHSMLSASQVFSCWLNRHADFVLITSDAYISKLINFFLFDLHHSNEWPESRSVLHHIAAGKGTEREVSSWNSMKPWKLKMLKNKSKIILLLHTIEVNLSFLSKTDYFHQFCI